MGGDVYRQEEVQFGRSESGGQYGSTTVGRFASGGVQEFCTVRLTFEPAGPEHATFFAYSFSSSKTMVQFFGRLMNSEIP